MKCYYLIVKTLIYMMLTLQNGNLRSNLLEIRIARRQPIVINLCYDNGSFAGGFTLCYDYGSFSSGFTL